VFGHGRVDVLVASVCRNLGIDPTGQRLKLKRNAFFRRHLKTSASTSLGGRGREALSLNNDSLPGWLASITVERDGCSHANGGVRPAAPVPALC
jgi:hypothetical protein